MEPRGTHAFAVGQGVRSLARYYRGEVGTVIARHPADRPAYAVEGAGGPCVYLLEDDLQSPDAET